MTGLPDTKEGGSGGVGVEEGKGKKGRKGGEEGGVGCGEGRREGGGGREGGGVATARLMKGVCCDDERGGDGEVDCG